MTAGAVTAGARGIAVEPLTTAAELEALRPEWTRLWHRAGGTPFQSPAWLLPWWRHFGRGEPLVLALRRTAGGELLGVAPFHTWTGDGDRRLLFIGTGNTDHLDALLHPDAAAEGAAAILAELARHRDAWDACDLQQLPARSPLLAAPVPPSLRAATSVQDVCPVLPLPAPPAQLRDVLPRARRRQLATARNRAARLGSVCFEAADERTLPELLEALVRLHGARWAQRDQTGVLADPVTRAFHAEAAAALLALGALRLYALRIDDRIVGVYHGLADRRRAYYYIGGFDPSYEAVSPGALLVAHALEQAARVGAGEFDFLRGREPYKYAWGATDRPSYRRVLRHADQVAAG
ncbi:MAG TPA: GNAT family N-acetyltransferase [Gemmatimonadaceae bacterium]|nr:GNAT family N-acetyltransferase [Gemmatimonadaceae bacterium]